eukprot:6175454-Pleurochrysis_carterae.AAC.1
MSRWLWPSKARIGCIPQREPAQSRQDARLHPPPTGGAAARAGAARTAHLRPSPPPRPPLLHTGLGSVPPLATSPEQSCSKHLAVQSFRKSML